MSKYVIKNCPALGFQIGYYCSDMADYCKNCTDCLLKKIVERLIKVCQENLCSRCDGCDWENGCGDKSCGTYQANEILTNLLDIEECE